MDCILPSALCGLELALLAVPFFPFPLQRERYPALPQIYLHPHIHAPMEFIICLLLFALPVMPIVDGACRDIADGIS